MSCGGLEAETCKWWQVTKLQSGDGSDATSGREEYLLLPPSFAPSIGWTQSAARWRSQKPANWKAVGRMMWPNHLLSTTAFSLGSGKSSKPRPVLSLTQLPERKVPRPPWEKGLNGCRRGEFFLLENILCLVLHSVVPKNPSACLCGSQYLKDTVTDAGRDGGTLSIHWFKPQINAKVGAGPGESQSREHHPGFPCRWQGPSDLGHLPVLSQVS